MITFTFNKGVESSLVNLKTTTQLVVALENEVISYLI